MAVIGSSKNNRSLLNGRTAILVGSEYGFGVRLQDVRDVWLYSTSIQCLHVDSVTTWRIGASGRQTMTVQHGEQMRFDTALDGSQAFLMGKAASQKECTGKLSGGLSLRMMASFVRPWTA